MGKTTWTKKLVSKVQRIQGRFDDETTLPLNVPNEVIDTTSRRASFHADNVKKGFVNQISNKYKYIISLVRAFIFKYSQYVRFAYKPRTPFQFLLYVWLARILDTSKKGE